MPRPADSAPSDQSPDSVPNPVLSQVTRSGRVESRHRGAIAVVHDGELALSLGGVAAEVYARSVVKPLQALPFFERGLDTRLGLSPAEIAVMCASHDGTPLHTELVRTFLRRGELNENHLRCGPHAPFDPAIRRAMLRDGQSPARMHNNCSGKHTGFLHLARACGDDLGDYLDPGSRCQREIHDAVVAMTGLAGPIPTGIDGCGAPTFWLPLQAIAHGFCQLANPTGVSDVRAEACRKILAAVGTEPVSLAGERRFCTALVRAFPGRAFAKNGAEGVYAVALAPDSARTRWPGALGIAVKVDDGQERGYQPVVMEVLRQLGAFAATPGVTDGVPAALESWWRLSIGNTQKRNVGEVSAVFEWPA